MVAFPLSFRHRLPPYRFRRCFSRLMPCPVAITWMFVISPTTSDIPLIGTRVMSPTSSGRPNPAVNLAALSKPPFGVAEGSAACRSRLVRCLARRRPPLIGNDARRIRGQSRISGTSRMVRQPCGRSCNSSTQPNFSNLWCTSGEARGFHVPDGRSDVQEIAAWSACGGRVHTAAACNRDWPASRSSRDSP